MRRMPVLLLLLAGTTAAAEENDLAGYSDSFLDRTADPCADFYRYACGGWMKTHPIPADRPAWDRYYQLEEASHAAVHRILEDAKARPTNALEKRIGAYYAACTDEATIEKKGLAPLAGELARIRAVKDLPTLAKAFAHLQAIGAEVGFQLYSRADARDSSQVIAGIDQGGIAMADRSDYLETDPHTLERQARYRQHVTAMLKLAGESDAQAAADFGRIWKIESAFATASLGRKERRDPKNREHHLTRAELEALAPTFPWRAYFSEAGAPAFDSLNVVAPDFLKGLEALLHSEDLKAWRAYLTWELLDASAALLPKAFASEDFDFYQRYLHGVTEPPPRWKQCARLVNRDLGDAVGQLYVARFFPPERKAQMEKLIGALEDALEKDVTSLDWMTEATRKEALDKLHRVRMRVGHPEVWRDFGALVTKKDDALGNSFRGRAFDHRFQLAKIGHAVDPSEWGEPPQVVDGYHSSERNEIGFTAAILQPPFVDASLGEAVILGEAGRMIGHELTHGFDDQGRKFDGKGDLRDWWTAEDAKAYETRAACFADEYARFGVEDLHLDGRLTLGENIADNGGLRLAYAALHRAPATEEDDRHFFLAFAQSQCANVAPQTARTRVTTDPHSPAAARVNGTVQNMPEFAKAFRCQAGAPLAPEKRCRLW